jgi:hypothetical protein
MGTEALQRRPPPGIEFLVSPRAVTGAQKVFPFDDPRGTYGIGLWGLLYLSFLLPLSVVLALSPADLLPFIAFPVLPNTPFFCLVAAILAAVTLHWITRMEYLAAPFQKANAVPRVTRALFSIQTSFFGLI